MTFFTRISAALTRHASASGIGLAGVSGVFASAITDLASVMGPFLPAFFALSAAAAGFAAFKVYRAETAFETSASEPKGAAFYCKSLLVLIGALVGSGVLMVTGALTPGNDGSAILATIDSLRSEVAEVSDKVDAVGEQVSAVDEQVSAVDEQVAGIGKGVSIRDISGRSGTAMIGDIAVFDISLTDRNRMNGARCSLDLQGEWADRISVVNDDCGRFSVAMPKSVLLDDQGRSAGEIVAIPFDVTVMDSSGATLGAYRDTYPFYNNYRDLTLELDQAGNRFTLGERRRVEVTAGDGAILGDGVECEWSLSPHLDGVSFIPESEDNCSGWLSTELEDDSYVLRRLESEGGRFRARISVSVVTAADFEMIGIMDTQVQVSR